MILKVIKKFCADGFHNKKIKYETPNNCASKQQKSDAPPFQLEAEHISCVT